MLELEDRIRAEVTRQAERYVPADDLPERIVTRARHRRVVRRSAAIATAVAAVVALVALAGALSRPDHSGVVAREGTSTTTEPDRSTTSTTAGTTATDRSAEEGAGTTVPSTTLGPSTPAPPSSADPAGPQAPPGSPVASGVPLHRAGVGPIVAGMSVRAAEEASGASLSLGEPIGPTSTCRTGTIDGTELHVTVEATDAGADPSDSVIQRVYGGRSTAEGVRLGDSREAVRNVYGEPTDIARFFGNSYEMYQQGRLAYVVTIDGAGVVVGLQSGFPVIYPEGCA